jgi:hypothetical protein
MIYTIGHEESYMQAIAKSETGVIQKTGRLKADDYGGPYSGGYAFQTLEDAQRRIDEAYSEQGYIVFGLNADWEHDTEPAYDGWWHYLIHHSDIVILESR